MSKKLTDLKNIGKATEQMLSEIDIRSVADLRAMGEIESYLRLKFRFPKDVNVLMLYALYGALHDIAFNQIPSDIKARLKKAVER
jgi:DNA transformation protein and related proteins